GIASNYLVDRVAQLRYQFDPKTLHTIDCKSVQLVNFKKTKERKKFGNWDCVKWIPKEQRLKSNLAIWVSEDIPVYVQYAFLGNQFNGGIVYAEFVNGVNYTLMDYKYEEQKIIPEIRVSGSIPCDVVNPVLDFIFGK